MPQKRIGLTMALTSLTLLVALGVESSQATVRRKSDHASADASHKSEAPKEKVPTRTGKHKATTTALGGSERYLTCISTDKPIYKIGDTIYVRGVLLNAADKTPLTKDAAYTNVFVEIRSPKGETVQSGYCNVQDSVWTSQWKVPDEQSGGEYTIKATYPQSGHAPAQRKFDIRAYRAPRLKSQITFQRDGYGPGEKVTATLDVKRAEGGVPAGAKVTVNALVDGLEVTGAPGTVGSNGLCTVSFDLPKTLSRGDGTLALVVQDGGVVETASKTIPILLQTLDIEMFPEGGDLVAGLNNRVYVQAFQPNGKPADLVASVIEASRGKAAVAELRTEHEGRGRFEFVPKANVKYALRILKPSGIKRTFPLPEVKTGGAVIRSSQDVFKKNQPLKLRIASTHKKVHVTVAKREKELVSVDINPIKDSKSLESRDSVVPLPSDADGVLTVTVWDEHDVPLAERLIFREQSKPLNVSIKADKTSYAPGEDASVTVKTTDAAGKPLSAVVGITVTDDSLLQMVEKRDQPPALPVMLFLEPEVKDLADAQIYFNKNNAKAPLATDLLLGTQGWRRFAAIEFDQFVAKYNDKAQRAFAARGDTSAAPMPESDFVLDGPAPPPGAMPMNGVAIGGALGVDKSKAGHFVPFPVAEQKRPGDKFQVEPSVRDERHFAVAKNERHNANAKELEQAKAAPAIDASVRAGARFEFAPNQFRMDANQVAGKKIRAEAFLDERVFLGRRQRAAHSQMVQVREFAHKVRPDRKPKDRVDFAETLYWNAAVKTDAKTGEAKVQFGLNDSVTTFQVLADAFSQSGSIGANSQGIKSIQPFYAEAKLPLEVTAGDKILLPISLINATANTLQLGNVVVALPTPLFKVKPLLGGMNQLKANERARVVQPIEVGYGKGSMEFVMDTKAGPYQDRVVRALSVKPSGFPIEKAFGGILDPDKSATFKVTIEKNIVPQSATTQSAVYPSPLANMTGALERMIQDPYGCFEQTSSTSYPLTMAQQYFMSHSGVDQKLVDASRAKLDAGYAKLVSFWCPDRGYEWFGHDPGHEALTAFGLLHFSDMAKVRNVDQNMMTTTRAWLMKQRDGKGGFTRKRPALHTWIEDKDCSNAYILWAVLESGQSAGFLKPEIESLKAASEKSTNSYVLALAANVFELSGDKETAKKLMQRLASKQLADGKVDGITSSIVGSGGDSLDVEGTALATSAWMHEPEFAGNVEKSIKYLADQCKSGRYGSTQATVLALRAIVDHDKRQSQNTTPGKVRLYADGQPLGDWIAFDQSSKDSIKLPDFSELLSPGDHTVELRMDGGHPMPYTIGVKYNALIPASDKACKVDMSVKLAQSKVMEGSSTEALVTVVNTAKETIPTPVAIVGLPGGLEPRHDQLKELVKKHTIDAYEVLGRDVVLYWRALNGNEKVQIPISLIAAVPGTYTGPASRAYLYYTDEHKRWVDGLRVEVAAKK